MAQNSDPWSQIEKLAAETLELREKAERERVAKLLHRRSGSSETPAGSTRSAGSAKPRKPALPNTGKR